MNSIKNKMQNFHKGKGELEEYLRQKLKKIRYDPRPDLKEDSEYWQAVLKKAEKQNEQVYSKLHGFRIAGCRLKAEGGKLKLYPSEAIGEYWNNKNEWLQDRGEYLLPYKKEIAEIFQVVIKKDSSKGQSRR